MSSRLILRAAFVALAGAMAPVPAPAQVSQTSGTGSLRILGADGKPAAALPLRHTEIHAEVSGSIARVVVEQQFHNPYDHGIEAVYVFPLPHTAAVDDLEMRIGGRIVRATIRTRRAAREVYEQARREGRMTALLEQERPNIFTQNVANIQPGHTIRVRIGYVDMLAYRDCGYEMAIPTVVGPRFIPGRPVDTGGNLPASVSPPDAGGRIAPPGAPGTGWSSDTDRVPDASRITPPVVAPGERAGHDIGITVDVDAGVPLQSIDSPSHAVDIERPRATAARMRLRPADTIPNKDFVLRYRVAGAAPQFGVLAHRDPGSGARDGTFALFLQPKLGVTAQEARPKEVVFILDTSGSMSGEPLARSKAAMRWALQNLDPHDTFQIVRFSDATSTFSPHPVPCTSANVQRASLYIEGLEGQGGTHMLAGIEAALDIAPDPERLRIVCMLTDGYIGNEIEILAAVRQKIGDARLFSFGIGSSVNRYLLDELADEGRGCVDYVSLDGDVRPIVERFYARIARPYLTDIEVEWRGVEVEGVYPARIPDLFADHPLVLVGRYARPGRGEIAVRGKLGGESFVQRMHVELPARSSKHAVLASLWARRRIHALMQRMVQGEDSTLVAAVTDIALEYRLMSRYTSFVAADNQIVAKDGRPTLVPQAVEMPVGVSHEGVFGDATGAMRGASKGTNLIALPMESLSEAVALSPGAVVQSGVHIRGGRSAQAHTRTAPAQPINVPPAPPGYVEGDGRELDVDALKIHMQPVVGRMLRGDRIRVTLVIHNTSTHDASVPSVMTSGDLALRIERDGKPCNAPTLMNRRWRTVVLPPGATRTYRLVLDASPGEFASPGEYRVELLGIGAAAGPRPLATCTFVVR